MIQGPNYTQIPNEFIEAMSIYSDVEFRVLMVICRKTFGFHKAQDRISFSQLEKITGCSRSALQKAIKRLIEIGDVAKARTAQGNVYELVISEGARNVYLQDDYASQRHSAMPPRDTALCLSEVTQKKEINSTKEKNTPGDTHIAGVDAISNPPPKTKDQVYKDLRRFFDQEYERRYEAVPMMSIAEFRTHVKPVLDQYGEEKTKVFLGLFAGDNDEYIMQVGHKIRFFRGRINNYIETMKLERTEHERLMRRYS